MASTTSDPKARGAYYTPTEVAQFLASWAVRSPSASVLEPSAGDGVFIRAAYEVFARLGQVSGHVVGIEIDGPTVDALLEMAPDTATIIQSDFFAVDGGGFDAVIGNPPFVRYQRFTGANRDLALRRAAEAGVALPELSSYWAPFVVYAAHMLTPSGRLAMVVPAEITYSGYGQKVLAYLVSAFDEVTLIRFEKLLFPALGEDTLLLLAGEKRRQRQTHGVIRTVVLPSLKSLSGKWEARATSMRVACDAVAQGRLRLTLHLIPGSAAALYESLADSARVWRLGDVADIGIGYVTGANRYFQLNTSVAEEWELGRSDLLPIVAKGGDLAGVGLSFRRADWDNLKAAGKPCYLFRPEEPLTATARAYVARGEQDGVPDAYKCRVRSKWYTVPGVTVPDGILTVMADRHLKLVANHARVSASNSLHLVRLKPQAGAVSVRRLAATLWTSLGTLSAEVEGHSLGGGLLKVEPGEAARLLLPSPTTATDDELRTLDGHLRAGEIEQARRYADRVFLQRGLGLSEKEIADLDSAAHRLLSLRTERGRSSC